MKKLTSSPHRIVVRSQGRVTIPKELLKQAGLEPGDLLKVESRGPGVIVLVPQRRLKERE